MAPVKVWPLIIAVREQCFRASCPECGCTDAPQSFVDYVRLCPQCGGDAVGFESQGHEHFWAMLLMSTRGMSIWEAGRLAAVAHIPLKHRMGVCEWFDPYEDEATAIVEFSRDLGLLLPGDRA